MRSIFDNIEGLKPVDPADLVEYENGMKEAIQEMLDEKRRQYFAVPESGWNCPNCGRAHPVSVITCPIDNRPMGERVRAIN